MPDSENDLIFKHPAGRFLRCVLFAPLLVAASGDVLAQQTKIGFIDTQRVFREAGAAKTADAKIAQDFAIRDKELKELAARMKRVSDKFEKDGPSLSEADRTKRFREVSELGRDLQRKQSEFREDLSQRQSKEHSMFSERALAVVKRIADAESYDLIVDKSAWSNPRVDITEKVIKALEK